MEISSIFFKFFLLILCLLLPDCGIKKVQLKEQDASGNDSGNSIYKTISYDKYYRPVIADKIKRPGNIGDQFYIVIFKDNKPLRSYHILVEDIKRALDYEKPLEIVYKWTMDGFKTGGEMGQGFWRSQIYSGQAKGAVILAVVPVALALSGGTIGFVSGVGKSTYELSKDMKNLMVEGREFMLGYSDYYYDNNRLVKVIHSVPYKRIGANPVYVKDKDGKTASVKFIADDEPTEILEIRYYYKDNSLEPFKTIMIEKLPEKKEKEILF